MNVEMLSEQFYEYLKVKAFTDSTRKSYRIYLNKFLNYLKSESVATLEEITPSIIYNYQTYLYYAQAKTGKPLSVLTQHNALVVVKTFFSFLLETDKLAMDPSSGVHLPRKPQTLPDTMTVQEMDRLLEQPDCSTVLGFRNRAIMEVLYATGMRNSELCKLDVYDAHLDNEEIHIRHGKGGKERLVPLGEIAGEYVREYLQAIRPKIVKDNKEQSLFVSKSGKRIDPTDLLLMIKLYAKQAKLDASAGLGAGKRITPHTFRHTCATHMLQGGADIRYIQMMLGHESITSTQIYTHVEITDLKAVHRQYHPREKLDHA